MLSLKQKRDILSIFQFSFALKLLYHNLQRKLYSVRSKIETFALNIIKPNSYVSAHQRCPGKLLLLLLFPPFSTLSLHFCATAVQRKFTKLPRIHSLPNCTLRRQVSGSIPSNSCIMSANDDAGPASQKGHAIILFYRNK